MKITGVSELGMITTEDTIPSYEDWCKAEEVPAKPILEGGKLIERPWLKFKFIGDEYYPIIDYEHVHRHFNNGKSLTDITE